MLSILCGNKGSLCLENSLSPKIITMIDKIDHGEMMKEMKENQCFENSTHPNSCFETETINWIVLQNMTLKEM